MTRVVVGPDFSVTFQFKRDEDVVYKLVGAVACNTFSEVKELIEKIEEKKGSLRKHLYYGDLISVRPVKGIDELGNILS